MRGVFYFRPMSTFIQDVVSDLINKKQDFSNLVFVLPSRRAGVLLQKTIASALTQTIFSPLIYSIEEFIESVSGLRSITATELLFVFYEVYLELTPKEEQESFQTFIAWAPTLLDDINEIDRHLLNHVAIFDHLSAIQELDHWSKTVPTPLIENHLKFWAKLPLYYTALSERLLSNTQGHQGLLYRKASEEIEFYLSNTATKHHVFLGFNALNTSEERIIQTLLANGNSSVYWDAEAHFMNAPNHSAAVFLKKHKTHWKYFDNNTFNWVSNHFNNPKDITTTAVPQNIDQVKYISKLLAGLDTRQLNSTAIVLGDESIIIPLLNSLPTAVTDVNITMGLALNQTPLASFFHGLFSLQLSHSDKGYYYKNLLSLLKHPLSIHITSRELIDRITAYITTHNAIYVTHDTLLTEIAAHSEEALSLLLMPWNGIVKDAISNSNKLITLLLEAISYKEQALVVQYLQGFKRAFSQLENLCDSYSYINDIKVLERFYLDTVAKEVVDLRGNPHQGLQIMGMLESRILDFENVIITSVNEGVLPAGKTSHSFLPYDLKLHYGLPTYLEKDAVYTYHFYRLLHRAKTVNLLYTTTSSGLGSSEKSRLILQLEAEGVHPIKHQVAAAPILTTYTQVETIEKTPAVQEKIKHFFTSGISPSAIGTYLRNPLDFYYQYILRVTPPNQVEETLASNTLGTIVHNVLEQLYTPYLGKPITAQTITTLLSLSKKTVDQEYKKEYGASHLQGQNKIIYEVICRFIDNFLKKEAATLQSGATLTITSLENKLKCPLKHPELPFEINLKGTVDRVDLYNGVLRVIDYKTGTVEKSNLKIKEWSDLLAPEGKYEKAFQILLYAYMLNQKNSFTEPISAGIISTKKIQNGYMPFTIGKETLITQETLSNFEGVLVQLIQEINTPDIPFKDSGFSY